MKGIVYGVVGVVILAGGYLVAAHVSGGAFPTLGLPLGGEAGWLRAQTLSFWEDIQFKDFAKASSYHEALRQSEVDIPYLLERVFVLKPEALDIMDYEIVLADLDSSGLRARVKTRVRFKDLVREKVEEKEVILYWHRASPVDPWYMELETSLRAIEADKAKKH